MKNKKQIGRSMIEMLGVLAVIGVLSIGALAGFQYAMNKHRANETIHDVMLRASNVPMIDEQYTKRPTGYEWLFAGLSANGRQGTYYDMATLVSDLPEYVFKVEIPDVPKRVCRLILAMNPTNIDAIYVEGDKITDSDACPNDLNTMAFYFDEEWSSNKNNPTPPSPSPSCVGSDCNPDGTCSGPNCTICVGKDCDEDGNCVGKDCVSCKGTDCGPDGECIGSDCDGCQGEGCTPNPPTPPDPNGDPCLEDPDSLDCQDKCRSSANPYCCRYPSSDGCNCSSRPSCGGCESYVYDAKGCVIACTSACDATACEVCQNGVCESTCLSTQYCDNGMCKQKCTSDCDSSQCLRCEDGACVSTCTDGEECVNGTCEEKCPVTCRGTCEDMQIGTDEKGCPICGTDPDPCCGLTEEEAACCAAPKSSEACVRFCITHPENCVNDPCPEDGDTDAVCCAVQSSGTWCSGKCCVNGQTCANGQCCPALDPATCPNGTSTDENDCPICMDAVDCTPSIIECTQWCATHPDECIDGCSLDHISGPYTDAMGLTSCPGRKEYNCMISYTDYDGYLCDGCWLGIVCIDNT